MQSRTMIVCLQSRTVNQNCAKLPTLTKIPTQEHIDIELIMDIKWFFNSVHFLTLNEYIIGRKAILNYV